MIEPTGAEMLAKFSNAVGLEVVCVRGVWKGKRGILAGIEDDGVHLRVISDSVEERWYAAGIELASPLLQIARVALISENE